ncbi:hypothetical protein N7492_008215 [Penicillium capsulatum]|uniref:Uncharacterized protein n=1 Tax=Penicillium capsulatum TaxID=69766 RepID=A0A9W9LGV2_9EURO|nr:hypothetical protein N7492_008215 [Penicillium capsulatum]KAJ6105625.1 hypothetical protein N7512_009142 [Penicillium capsulatum]
MANHPQNEHNSDGITATLPGIELTPVYPHASKEDDPFLVTFAQPSDKENPQDWTRGHKWAVTDVMSATAFNRIMISTIMAPALSTIAAGFDMNSAEAAMSLSI